MSCPEDPGACLGEGPAVTAVVWMRKDTRTEKCHPGAPGCCLFALSKEGVAPLPTCPLGPVAGRHFLVIPLF